MIKGFSKNSFRRPPESGSASGGKAGIQKFLKSLDSRLRGNDELRIIRGPLRSKSLFISLLLVMLVIPVASIGEEFHKEGWQVPDLKNLVPYSIVIQKVDGIEKIIERFHTPDGGHVARISGNGKVFAYAVDRDQDPPIDYLLLDPDGSGRFTKRLKPEESYMIPEWIFR